AGWFTVYVVFFTCARTKLPDYVLPCYPAMALMTAFWFERAGEEGLFSKAFRDFTWAAWSLIAVGILMAIGLGVASTILLPGDTRLAAVGLVPTLGGLLVWWTLKHQSLPRARIVFAGVALAFTLTMFAWAAPRISRHQDGAFLAQEIQKRKTLSAP